MSPIARRRPLVAGLAALGVALSTLAAVSIAAPAQANPGGTGLVISEVYGGGGNSGAQYTHDFIELYNPTAAPIGVAGWSVQGRSATNTAAASGANITPLTGSVPAGGYYLVQEGAGAGNGVALPTPDATGAMGMGAGGWQVWLASTTVGQDPADGDVLAGTPNSTIIDFVGAATTSTSFEAATANEAPGNALATTRNGSNADTDNNANDFSTAAPTPQNSVGADPELTASDRSDLDANVGTPITTFDLEASGGTEPYTWDVTGLPDGITATSSGEVSGTPTQDGTFPVSATVTDSAMPAATDELTFNINVGPALSSIPIAEIQGDGAASPMVGDPVITEGVVTAAYPAGGFFGFYLQTEGTGGSVDPATRTSSDGIFVRQTVSAGAVTVEPGDFVEVRGTVTEFAGQTQVEVTSAADIETIAGAPDPVTPITTTGWPATDAEKEALEGMLYSPAGDFTITNNFTTNQFGELGLAVGDTPLIQPTQVAEPGSPEAAAVEADNAARGIILDDGSSTNFILTGNAGQCSPRPTNCLLNGHLTPPYISNTTPFRVGATGTFDDAVIFTQGGSPSAPTYRFEPIETVVGPANTAAPATFENTRTAAPDEDQIAADGEPTVKVASFNVLNYFTTLGDANDDNIGDGGCTPFRDRDDDGVSVQGGCDQRGAWDPQDKARQQEKIVSAINALDADVIGLMEIENSAALGEAADEATQTLVTALNAAAGPGTWAANPSSSDLPPAADMDVITNAIIYKPAAVTRLGEARALGDQSSGNGTATDEAFANAREPIAQAFTPVNGGGPFLVVVNHFKSKGSAGPFPGDADQGDGQGAGNVSRTKQATALAAWVPTVRGAVEDVLLLGDFNSYNKEDPLQVLYDDGYVDLEEESGNDEYSYSFSGLSGSLDHVLANASALERFTGADVWNINGVEPLPMEYSRFNYHSTNFHQPGPYRSSDHDPVVIGLAPSTKETPTITAMPNPASVVVNGGTSAIAVTVASPAAGDATGTVTASVDGNVVDTETLVTGTATLTVGPFTSTGTTTITVAYSGDAANSAGSTTTTVVVTQPSPTATSVSATVSAMTYGTAGTVTATVIPTGATGTVTVRNGATPLGSAALTGGSAQVTIPGTALEPGSHTLAVSYSGDVTHSSSSTTVTVVVSKAASNTAATANPSTVTVGVDQSTITVVVSSGAAQPTGTVEARVGGTVVDSGTLASGMATLTVGPFATVGTKTVEVRYLGDARIAASQDGATVVVEAAELIKPRIGVTHTPSKVRARTTRATLIVGVAAGNRAATGWIQLRIPGTVNGVVTKVARLERGRADVRLPVFKNRGVKRIRVTYKGNAATASGVAVHVIRVLPRQR